MIYVKTLLILNIFSILEINILSIYFCFFLVLQLEKGKYLFCLGNYNNGITQPRLRRRQKLLLK